MARQYADDTVKPCKTMIRPVHSRKGGKRRLSKSAHYAQQQTLLLVYLNGIRDICLTIVDN